MQYLCRILCEMQCLGFYQLKVDVGMLNTMENDLAFALILRVNPYFER